jgi:hypothetical protein
MAGRRDTHSRFLAEIAHIRHVPAVLTNMTAALAFALLGVIGYSLTRALAMPAARGVSVAARLDEARRIAAEDSVGRQPCEQPLDRPSRELRRHEPRSYVAHCAGGPALRLRHAPRS